MAMSFDADSTSYVRKENLEVVNDKGIPSDDKYNLDTNRSIDINISLDQSSNTSPSSRDEILTVSNETNPYSLISNTVSNSEGTENGY